MPAKTNRIEIIGIFSLLVIIVTMTSVNQWSSIPLSSPIIDWILFVLFLFCIYRIYIFRFKRDTSIHYKKFVYFYLLIFVIGILRGIVVADNYWDYKNLINNSISLSLPVLIIVFSYPIYTQKVLFKWLKYALPLFVIVIPFIDACAYSRFISPILLLGCFITSMEKKWRWLTIMLLLILVFADFGARTQVIKAIMCFVISIVFFIINKIPNRILQMINYVFYSLPAILLFLAFAGIFNVFAMDEYMDDIKTLNSRNEEESLTADTRTTLYTEIISSAVRNEYVTMGRTPARGYDSMQFGGAYDNIYKDTKRFERPASEMLHPNVFTWLGLLGVFSYGLLYFIASSKAINKANNRYIKLLGLYVAFRWMYGWVEEYNRWDIMNISLWIMISMCLSPYYRSMTDKEFLVWFRQCFPSKKT